MHKVNYKNIKITYYYLILFITCITTTQNRLKTRKKPRNPGFFTFSRLKTHPKEQKNGQNRRQTHQSQYLNYNHKNKLLFNTFNKVF